MSITDTQFRVGVGVGGAALVAALVALRFAGGVSLPPKPPAPAAHHAQAPGTTRALLASASASPVLYLDHIARDAATAGLSAPSIEALARKLPYRVDDVRRVLEIDQPALDAAGLRLRARRLDDALVLEVVNTTTSALAYQVVTALVPPVACGAAPPRSFNAMTIAPGHSELRVECGWRDGLALEVTRIETMEVPPLSAWYLDRLPPEVVGVEPRIARGHLAPPAGEPCRAALPQAVRSGLDRGEIGWRDLVDFYARHRCQTYQFPLSYRAFKQDGEHDIPAVSESM